MPIFTGSAADVRKLGEPLPLAGYGFHATEGGRGHEHAGGRSVAEEGGQINMDTPNVQTINHRQPCHVGWKRFLRMPNVHSTAFLMLSTFSDHAAAVSPDANFRGHCRQRQR